MKKTTQSALRAVACSIALAGVLAAPAAAGAQTDRAPDRAPVRQAEPKPIPEELRLHCNGRSTDEGRAAVVCEWTPSQRRNAAGYALVRTNGDQREVVFSTRSLTETRAIDADIRVGVRYTYVVLVKDANGRTIGSGGPVTAGVEKPADDLEVLHMACAQRADLAVVGCEWRPTASEAAVGYQLWRIVDRGERELIWRGGLDTISHVSRVPADATVARYAVLAVDKDGKTVGQSRPQTVHLRHRDLPVRMIRSGLRTFI